MKNFKSIKKKLTLYIKGILKKFNSNKKKLKISRFRWANLAQKGEFEFHKTNKWRNSPDFTIDNDLLFESFGFNKNDFEGNFILELGAGSKLRSKYFRGAKVIAIEPMAAKCLQEIEWSDLKDAYKLFATPAENYIKELENSIDFVLSINVLDHCFDIKKIIENIVKYLKPDGMVFLSFDSHDIADEMHPLILNEKICSKLFLKAGLRILKVSKGFSGGFKEKFSTDTYGHGAYCLNYWLCKNG